MTADPKKMRAILDSKLDVLQNELALSLDLSRIISVVHRLEGDGLLPLLAYDEVNALLIFGFGKAMDVDQDLTVKRSESIKSCLYINGFPGWGPHWQQGCLLF